MCPWPFKALLPGLCGELGVYTILAFVDCVVWNLVVGANNRCTHCGPQTKGPHNLP